MLRRYYQKKLDEKIRKGIVVLDKQPGFTSHDEVNALRGIFKTRKVGHSGTLDPKVTGVLVCGLGKGTKVLEYVLMSQKIYDGELVLHKTKTKEDVQKAIDHFTGTISQLPPTRSSVVRQERERTIYDMKLCDFDEQNKTAQIRFSVERGTYIRKLCHDMGEYLGGGAHMGELRRIQAGPVTLDNAAISTIPELRELKKRSKNIFTGWSYTRKMIARIGPVEKIITGIPKIVLELEVENFLKDGMPLFVPGVLAVDQFESGDLVWLQNSHGACVAIGYAQMSSGEIMDKKRNEEKGIAVRLDKVLL